MITIFIWLAALFCTNPNHTAADHGNCSQIHVTTTNSEGETGGETGGRPPTPPPPPPPPPSGN